MDCGALKAKKRSRKSEIPARLHPLSYLPLRTPLEASHDQLRGAVIAAGRELRKLPKTKRRVVLLKLLRETLADARKARKA